jgi:hypothetical protein
MKAFFLKMIFGEAVIKEYSTVKVDGEIREKVYLQTGAGGPILDVSTCHWLLCLDPIVFGVWAGKEQIAALDKKGGYTLYFRDEACPRGKDPGKNAVAVLQMDLLDKIEEEKGTLFLFRLVDCRIHPISFVKTRLLYSKFYKKPGLSFYKLKSFAAAYSYPRRVRIISFRGDDYYNIFPMDLLGDIPQAGRYVFGLRHTNLALSRIIEAKKIVVSEIPFGYKEMIYRLGSHHSTNPPSIGELPFGVIPSPDLRFWIPEWAESCKEIRILRTMNLGSHMLLWGEPVTETILKPATAHLHHIHFLYFLHQKKKGNPYPLV